MSGNQKHKWNIHAEKKSGTLGFKKTNNNTSEEDIDEADQKQFKSTLKNNIEIKVQQ